MNSGLTYYMLLTHVFVRSGVNSSEKRASPFGISAILLHCPRLNTDRFPFSDLRVEEITKIRHRFTDRNHLKEAHFAGEWPSLYLTNELCYSGNDLCAGEEARREIVAGDPTFSERQGLINMATRTITLLVHKFLPVISQRPEYRANLSPAYLSLFYTS